MTSSPLFDIFKHLTKQDRFALKDFVHSPFHNKREDVVLLFDYIDLHFTDGVGGGPFWEKEPVYKAIFPEKKTYDDKAMRYTMSFLLKCIRQYLICNELKNNELDSEMKLNRALRQRTADKAYQKNLSESYQSLETQPLRNAEFHLQKFQLLESEPFHGKSSTTGSRESVIRIHEYGVLMGPVANVGVV